MVIGGAIAPDLKVLRRTADCPAMEPEGKPRGSSLPAALGLLLVLAVGAIVLLVLLNSRGADTPATGATGSDVPVESGPFSTLYGLDGYGGAAPSGVALDPDGDGLFVVPSGGGATSMGSMVRYDLDDASATAPYSFDLVRGGVPSQVPVVSRDGETLYGTTSRGGDAGVGTVWRMNADGTDYSALVEFAPPVGSAPLGPPVLSNDGSTLFGATSQAGPGGYGTLYRIETTGKGFSVLHAFTGGSDGGSVLGALTPGRNGTLFGMSFDGGSERLGTIFRIGTDGRGFRILHDFTGGRDDGSGPQLGHLVLGPDGRHLYGMTRVGGTDDAGTIFRIGTDGRGFDVLHSFSVDDGAQPYGSLTVAPRGAGLYGLTSLGGAMKDGVLFHVDLDGKNYEVLHNFELVVDGGNPLGAVVIDRDAATLYGVTSTGGPEANAGAIFAYDLGD